MINLNTSIKNTLGVFTPPMDLAKTRPVKMVENKSADVASKWQAEPKMTSDELPSFSLESLSNRAMKQAKESALDLARNNPGVASTVISAVTSSGLRALGNPIYFTLDNMFFKNKSFGNSLKEAIGKGLYKGAGVAAANSLVGTGAYLGGVQAYAGVKANISDLTHEEAEQGLAAKVSGAISNAIMTTPLDNVKIKIQQQGKSLKQIPIRSLMNGVSPSILVSLGGLGVGFTIGEKIYNAMNNLIDNESLKGVSAKITGLTIGNFLTAPLHNWTRQVRLLDGDLIKGAQAMGWAYNPQEYSKEAYTVTSKLARGVLGMGLAPENPEKSVIKPDQKIKLNAYTVMKNYKKGWKCFGVALPVMVLSNLILAGAIQTGQQITKPKAIKKEQSS